MARTRAMTALFRRAALLALVLAPRLHAQAEDARPHPEVRLDAIANSHLTSVQGGAGIQVPVGYYVRVGVDGALGADIFRGNTMPGESSALSGRVDVITRFLFDPFRQQRLGFSAGGGVSLRASEGSGVTPYLVVVLDLEGPRSSSGLAPAFQVGLGGGVRAGLVFRWAAPRVR